MTDGDKRPVKPSARDSREARLAAALRDNLRRRKAADSSVSDAAGAKAGDEAPDQTSDDG